VQGASEEVVQAQIAPSAEDPQPLSEEEMEEKERLLAEGFSSWNRRDFNAFVRACEKVSPLLSPPAGGCFESCALLVLKKVHCLGNRLRERSTVGASVTLKPTTRHNPWTHPWVFWCPGAPPLKLTGSAHLLRVIHTCPPS